MLFYVNEVIQTLLLLQNVLICCSVILIHLLQKRKDNLISDTHGNYVKIPFKGLIKIKFLVYYRIFIITIYHSNNISESLYNLDYCHI